MIPSNDERVGVRLAGRFQQRFFDGTDGNADRNFEADGSLKFSDAATCPLSLRRLDLLLKVKLNWEAGISGLDRMDNGELAARLSCYSVGESQYSIRIGAQSYRA